MKSKLAAQFLLTTILIISFTTKSEGAPENTTADSKFNTIFYFSMGASLGTVSNDFFKEYNGSRLGMKNSFDNYPLLSAGNKLDFYKGFRFGVHVDYLYSEMREDNSFSDTILDQEILIKTIPAFVTFEIVPFSQQFRTYVGLGAGICFSEIIWKENILNANDTDIRKGGIHYNEQEFFPAFRIYSGIELGFDSKVEESFLGSLLLEVSYTYIYRKVGIFGKISEQYTEVPDNWDDKFGIIPGYLGLNIGISFNFNKKTVNKNN